VSIASDGSGSPDTVGSGIQLAISPDGSSLVSTIDRRGNADLWITPLHPRGPARPFLATANSESDPGISPDGHWITYVSDESGQDEVYVRRFPEGDQRAQVSVGGGRWPSWTRRGDAIYYVKHETLNTVSIRPGTPPVLGLPRPLFGASAEGLDLSNRVYGGAPVNEHPDGLRFVVVRRTNSPSERALIVVENWFEEFRRR
jgi:dipeptidyl aminopeptidase/acylaminoacyl peptidase